MNDTDTRTRAAALFISAYNTVFEDDHSMVVTVHAANGSAVSAAGHLTEGRLTDFDPDDLSPLLDRLALHLAQDRPDATLTIYVPEDIRGTLGRGPYGWAWSLRDGAPLDEDDADTYFPDTFPDIPLLPKAPALTIDGRFPHPPAASLTGRVQAEIERRGLRLDTTGA